MKSAVLRMSLCAVLLFSPHLYASDDADLDLSELFQKLQEPTVESNQVTSSENDLLRCTNDFLPQIVSLLRYRDFSSMICTSHSMYDQLAKKQLMLILSLVGPSWGQRAQFICYIGESDDLFTTHDNDSEVKKDQLSLMYQFAKLENQIPFSGIEKFQLYLQPVFFKMDPDLFSIIAIYLKRMENLQTLRIEIGNVDKTPEFVAPLNELISSFKYLEGCRGKISTKLLDFSKHATTATPTL